MMLQFRNLLLLMISSPPCLELRDTIFQSKELMAKMMKFLSRLMHLWIWLFRKIPFQEKHVLSLALILGNMEEFGVRRSYDGGEQCEGNISYENDVNVVPAVVEFEVGKGYLTQMLSDCYGIKMVFLVERQSYKLKFKISDFALMYV